MADIPGLAITLLNASLQINELSERLHVIENQGDFVFPGPCFRCMTYGHRVKFCSQRRRRRSHRKTVKVSNVPEVTQNTQQQLSAQNQKQNRENASLLKATQDGDMQNEGLRSQVNELQQETARIPALEEAVACCSEENAVLLSEAEKLRTRVDDLVGETRTLQAEVCCLEAKRRRDKKKLKAPRTVDQTTQTSPSHPDAKAEKTRHRIPADVDTSETEAVDSTAEDPSQETERRRMPRRLSHSKKRRSMATDGRTSHVNFITLFVFRVLLILNLAKQMFCLLIGYKDFVISNAYPSKTVHLERNPRETLLNKVTTRNRHRTFMDRREYSLQNY